MGGGVGGATHRLRIAVQDKCSTVEEKAGPESGLLVYPGP